MIGIVTDSASYIPTNIVKQYNIEVTALNVHFGQETFNEITGISNQEFYRRLATADPFPTTSQPSAGQFQHAYQKILRQNPQAEILVLTISSKLSGTYNSALIAAEQLPEAKITVFDSLSAAMGLGLMVITAAEMGSLGKSLAEIMNRLRQMRVETRIVFMVDTLEYLKRGGRIGAAAAFLGTLLNAKPILALEAGELQPIDRVRTKKKAIERLLQELEHKFPHPDHPIQAAVMHISAAIEADHMVNLIQDRFKVTRFFISEIGPVVGAHIGPGGLAVGICPEPWT